MFKDSLVVLNLFTLGSGCETKQVCLFFYPLLQLKSPVSYQMRTKALDIQ